MYNLFSRDATFTVGGIKIQIRAPGDTMLFSSVGNYTYAPIAPALRVVFSVERDTNTAPNTATVTIYNLAEQRRNSIKNGDQFIIEAGYLGNVSQLFKGKVSEVAHKHERVDWITTVSSGDGLAAFGATRASLSYAPKTLRSKVISDLAKQMKIGLGNVNQKLAEVQLRKNLVEFANGFSTSGAVKDALSKVVGSAGLQWSIQDEQLQLLEPDGTTIDTVVVLTPDTGLVGTPEIGEAKGKGSKATIKARSLLQGAIRPGRRLLVQARSVNGQFRADKVTHSGDSYGGDWYTDFEGVQIA